MDNDFQPIDFGTRSNDSDFGGLDDLPTEIAASSQAHRPSLPRSRVRVEHLPFRIGIVDSEALLAQAQGLRGEAYGRHLPGAAAKFGSPDPIDREPGVTVFYARDKETTALIGTARLQTNLFGPLQIEGSIVLPADRRDQPLCEVTRLAVQAGSAPGVRLALVKAIQLFCIANQICGILIGSRRSLMRQYTDLGFKDFYGDERMVPLKHGSDLEHRIIFLDTVAAESESRDRSWYTFLFRTYHPDIQVFDSTLYQGSTALQRPHLVSEAA